MWDPPRQTCSEGPNQNKHTDLCRRLCDSGSLGGGMMQGIQVFQAILLLAGLNTRTDTFCGLSVLWVPLKTLWVSSELFVNYSIDVSGCLCFSSSGTLWSRLAWLGAENDLDISSCFLRTHLWAITYRRQPKSNPHLTLMLRVIPLEYSTQCTSGSSTRVVFSHYWTHARYRAYREEIPCPCRPWENINLIKINLI